VAFKVDSLGTGLGDDGVTGKVEVGKSCFCEIVVPTDAKCCFGGEECCVEDDCSFLCAADGSN